jgi:hypothetical protein
MARYSQIFLFHWTTMFHEAAIIFLHAKTLITNKACGMHYHL